MNAIKGLGQAVVGILVICASLLVLALFIHGLAWVAEQMMWLVFWVAQITIAVCILILLPLAIFRGTRTASCFGLYGGSVVFGICAWLVGFSVTYFYWGGFAVILGIMLGFVGIVPIGMLAALIKADWSALAILTAGIVLTFGTRAIAVALAVTIDRDAEHLMRTAQG